MARMETIEVVADVSSMPPGFLLSAGANLFVPARCDGSPARREGHLINPEQRRIHHLLAGADGYRRNRIVSAITAFGHSLDGWEVLVVAIAIAKEKELLHPGTFFQADRVIAEKFTGNADQRDIVVE